MDSVTRCPCVKEKSVADIIEEVITEVCDNYCKFSEQYAGRLDELNNEKCGSCPLNRL